MIIMLREVLQLLNMFVKFSLLYFVSVDLSPLLPLFVIFNPLYLAI